MKAANNPRWNPTQPIEVPPEVYERQVISWLRSAGTGLPAFSVTHLKKKQGCGGEYSLDGWVEFKIFGGAKVSVLVECKRHGRPLERDVILGVHAKAQAIGAQKSIVFSTSGFQSGAVEFATHAGMALVTFVDGKTTYVTRSQEPLSEQSYPPDLPEFAGQLVQAADGKTSIATITNDRLSPLEKWLESDCNCD